MTTSISSNIDAQKAIETDRHLLRNLNVQKAIQTASEVTNVDKGLLKKIAYAESALNPNARSNSSTASGLFQFIRSTWDDMVDDYGDHFGAMFGIDHWDVLNPLHNSLMGAQIIKDNICYLNRRLKREPSFGEVYMAHFFGAGTAGRFLAAYDENPHQLACEVTPTAARSNHSIFYYENGQPRTVDAVHALLSKKVDSHSDYAEVAKGIDPAVYRAELAKKYPGYETQPQFGDGMARGEHDTEVMKLQRYLKQAGFQCGDFGSDGDGVDGKFGRVTRRKLMAFQKSVGITASGIMDDKTMAALEREVDKMKGVPLETKPSSNQMLADAKGIPANGVTYSPGAGVPSAPPGTAVETERGIYQG